MTTLIHIIGNLSLFFTAFWGIMGGLYLVATAYALNPEDAEDSETKKFGIAAGLTSVASAVILVLYFVNVVWKQ